VLINQSPTFTDLICTVDSFEDRLLGAIDGNRTLGEILRLVLPDGDRERRALRFFERLWQYDHIVFDVSRAGGRNRTRSEGLPGRAAAHAKAGFPGLYAASVPSRSP
jgi:hypothetical protein